MKELIGDMYDIPCDALCITTNASIKNNGKAVMGRGCAKTIQRYFPDIPQVLANSLKQQGNHVAMLYDTEPAILSFPSKPIDKYCQSHDDYVSYMKFNIGSLIPSWACKSSIEVIRNSAQELLDLTNQHQFKTVLLPRVGCGAGELNWLNVKPILDEILDNRFIAMTFKE